MCEKLLYMIIILTANSSCVETERQKIAGCYCALDSSEINTHRTQFQMYWNTVQLRNGNIIDAVSLFFMFIENIIGYLHHFGVHWTTNERMTCVCFCFCLFRFDF